MQFMLLFSHQGKLRLQKWYVPLSDKEKKKITRELVQTVLARKPKMCSFLEWRDLKIVYKRYASLYFCCVTEDQDNELITLEIIVTWNYLTSILAACVNLISSLILRRPILFRMNFFWEKFRKRPRQMSLK
ncbi:AP-1 complex subunit sigma-2 [Lemmus lemmus]